MSGTETITGITAGTTNFGTLTETKCTQTITFGAQGAQTYSSGGTFAISPIATTTSGLTIAYTSTTLGVCTIAGTTVTIVTAGTCTIAANQAGNTNYNAATQVTQNITINKANQTISFTSSAPAATVGGATYTPTATATSGLTVAFTIDATSSSVCSISVGVVSFLTAGTCTIDANQTGNTNYNAAAQVQQSFTVNNLVPTTTSISPASKNVGDVGFSMTVNGTNFVSTSQVKLGGVNRVTTYVSATQLTVAILTADMTTAATYNVTVVNPTPGGGTSNAQTFTVNNLGPTTTSISPTSKNIGDVGFSMTVNGTNFVSTSQVQLGGANRVTTYVSATQLSVAILTADMTTAATYNVTVVNPTPGGGTSNAQTFTVNNLVPTTTSISPASKNVGDGVFSMTVNGTNFVSGSSVVRFDGSNRTTTFVSATQLTASIPASDMTTAGTHSITVFNPTPGGGTSNAQTFTTLPLTVVSINCAVSCAATSAATVSWTVTFSTSVTGVDATAFSLVSTGLSGAYITTVTGSGTTWTVTANTGIGAGTLGLNQTGPGSVSPTLSGSFTGQVYTINATPALAEYRMDEAGWSGTAGEVVDSSGSYPGTAMNNANTTDGSRAIPGNPGTCRYGVFDNGGTITQGYVALPGFPNLTTDFTITAWIRTTDNTVGAQRILIDDETNTGGYGLSLSEGGTGLLRFYARGSSVIILDTPNVIANNTWYFVAGVADISNGIRKIYVYDASGNLLPGLPVSVASTGWGTDAGMASIGGETNASGEPPAANHFKGNIDEVRVYQKVLNQSALAALATQTHVCAVIVTPPGGFNAYETGTAAGAITGVIKTKIAGSTISLDMIALNPAKTAIATTFVGTVRVEVLNASNDSGALDGNGCRPTWTVIQTLSPDPAFVAGDNGRKTISFTQANSYPNARLRITFPAGAPTATGCSNDNFAIRPNAFANFAVTDTDWQTTGTPGLRALNLLTFAATTPTHKAGQPFSVRATALNAAGTPAVTTNYTGVPTATLTACAGAACTATFGALALGTTFAAGQLASDVASYNNVGSFRLELVDSSFAGVDALDSSALEREIRSGTIDVGRFVPDHFAVSFNAPVFGTACGSFTYIGQAFNYATAPAITVTAQDFANTTTTLYNTIGSWFRITNASLAGKAYTAATGTLDTSGLPGTDPVIVSTGAGVGTLTFSSGAGLFFTRTTPTAPASPYDADISLAINVIDADGVILASNPARFGTATAGNGIAFSSGKPMRFGRLRLQNANGSQLIAMPIPISTQYWNGSGFVTNTLDNCTTIALNNIAIGNPQPVGFTVGAPTVGGVFNMGIGTLRLPASGAGTRGSVDVSVNLTTGAVPSVGAPCITTGMPNTTPSNRTYLQGAWCGATYVNDPTARATFGVYRNTDKFIYQQENF